MSIYFASEKVANLYIPLRRLNATFGNAVEAIVGIVALQQNQLRIVQNSMLGSILSNLLLVLGCSFWAAGKNYKQAKFQITAAQTNGSILMLAGATLIIRMSDL